MTSGGRNPRIKNTKSLRVVTFKATEEEHRALKALASDAGLTVSDLIRLKVLRCKVKRPVNVPKVNIEVYRALARSAANLNQMTRHLNEGRVRGEDRSISKNALRGTLKTMYKRIQELRQLIIGGEYVG